MDKQENDPQSPIAGKCVCGNTNFQLERAPLFVHCCHCRWCQRETGSAFALNALIETEFVTLISGELETINTASASGMGQLIHRCVHCKVALWSHYNGMGPVASFVRIGTLANPDQFPPDIHIFTSSKQPWVVLPENVPTMAEYYDRREYWSEESLTRHELLVPLIKAHRASLKSD